jgi:hypothetical protein
MSSDRHWRFTAAVTAVVAGITMGVAQYRYLMAQRKDERRNAFVGLLLGLVPNVLRISGWAPEKGRLGGNVARHGSRMAFMSALGHFGAGMGYLLTALARRGHESG